MLTAFAIAAWAASADETRLFRETVARQSHVLVAQCRAADRRRALVYLADGGALYAELESADAVALLADLAFDANGQRSFETNGGVETYTKVGARIDAMLRLPARFVRPARLADALSEKIDACR